MNSDPASAAFAMSMAMHANLDALAYQLDDAAGLVSEARDAMKANNRNLAIGTVLSLERTLPQCMTVLQSVLALQAWHNVLPQREGGAA